MSELKRNQSGKHRSKHEQLSRVQGNKRKKKNRLAAVVLIIAIAFVALFPTFHYFLSNNPTAKDVTVQSSQSSKESSTKSQKSSSTKSQKSSSKKSQSSSEVVKSSSSSSVTTTSASHAESSQSSTTSSTTEETDTNANSYTAVQGDSLYAIAQANGVSIDDLLRLNNLTLESPIYPGTTLKLK
ncbi:hypothetical protein FC62_GL000249 [Amylolactobacillus amylotrophicus DSM 20534]|uniref:Uncharacterized protein n=3 Tax=Amylolactobacillus TaxID=2767876 RepID=A0A0R1YS48_9LACO|nr:MULTISPECIES: LysM domain-containing protein [Amylolactobacillus]APT19167.1 hypothetical protein LA20533_07860 [Amylolactobacillus amylophilus DSM 20533 = JCM 1125]KRK38562.1 hypothetical protein FC62_GL000249 [Amylolactobacillus amylotrophicus DSM 20534]KRM42795.1 hypothetical protein FD40_GL000590 [Amylolactobacillus amylophilus DSM 20533 = JCM 1125]GED79658.1 hypothetical protein LAM01_01310 [Amylolactobacillus amylophilus]